MAKLGYTWYPKDWGNSEKVFELTLLERGLYRELIDMAMLNDNKTEVNVKTWARKFGSSIDEIEVILITLNELDLIQLDKEFLFIPSCEPRLNLVRGGRNGGKKSKPTESSIKNLTESLSEASTETSSKPNIKETKKKRKENKIETNNKPFNFYDSLIDLGADKQLVNDWLKVRKEKRAINSQTAYNGFLNKAMDSDLNINEILTICCERSWASFKPEWVKNNKPNKPTSSSSEMHFQNPVI